MKFILRTIMFLALMLAAISLYAMGQQAGAFAIVILGFCIEGLAWWLVFRKKSASTPKPSAVSSS
jgi:hypothetical protein